MAFLLLPVAAVTRPSLFPILAFRGKVGSSSVCGGGCGRHSSHCWVALRCRIVTVVIFVAVVFPGTSGAKLSMSALSSVVLVEFGLRVVGILRVGKAVTLGRHLEPDGVQICSWGIIGKNSQEVF